MKRIFSIRNIALNAIIAALYVVMTVLEGELAFGPIQIRFAEAFNVLIYFNPTLIAGLCIGCVLSNIILPFYGLLDIIFGTFATFLAGVLIILISKTIKNLFLSSLMPTLTNMFIVPFIILAPSISGGEIILWSSQFWADYIFLMITVGAGQFIACTILGYPLFLILGRTNKTWLKLIGSQENLELKW